MGRGTIEFNLKKAMLQADKLDSIAGSLSRLSGQDFEMTMQNLAANWKGDNATLYLAKGGKLQSDMSKTARQLQEIAGDIRRAARKMYRAELAALEIAENRGYK